MDSNQNFNQYGAPGKFCHNCGKPVDPNAEICLSCGVRQQTVIPGGKSRIAAGVLGILLGGLGVHKFYMGKIGLGILYLIFCWTGIPSIIGLIEGIIYLCEDDNKFAKRLAQV